MTEGAIKRGSSYERFYGAGMKEAKRTGKDFPPLRRMSMANSRRHPSRYADTGDIKNIRHQVLVHLVSIE